MLFFCLRIFLTGRRVRRIGKINFMSVSDQLLRWNWQRTAILVVAILAILQLYRANRPPPPAPPNRAVIYTAAGPIVDAAVAVPAGDFVSYKLNLNRRANISGTFESGNKAVEITCIVTDAANFEAWKDGKAAKHVADTGEVPAGQVARKLEPGTYYLVLSNRDGRSAKTLRASFRID